MSEDVSIVRTLSKVQSSVDEESPEEGEIQDDSSEEEPIYGGSITSQEKNIYVPKKNKLEVCAPPADRRTTRRSSRNKAFSIGRAVPEPPGRVGYPACVQEVYSSSFRDGTDLRCEKENQIGVKITRHGYGSRIRDKRRVSAKVDIGFKERSKTPEQLFARSTKVEPYYKKHHISEDRKRCAHTSTTKKKKSKQDSNDVIILSDSDIEEQIQKTKQRLKHENFKFEELITSKKSSKSGSDVISSNDLNKSSSSLDTVDTIPVHKTSVTTAQSKDSFKKCDTAQEPSCRVNTTVSDVPVEIINTSQAINCEQKAHIPEAVVPVQSSHPVALAASIVSNSNQESGEKPLKSGKTEDKTGNLEERNEELALRVLALKSVIQTKYGTKRKDKKSIAKENSTPDVVSDNIQKNLIPTEGEETEPVDMDLSLTDDEKEENPAVIIVNNATFNQAASFLNYDSISNSDIMLNGPMSGASDDQYIVMDEVGCSSASQENTPDSGKLETGGLEDDEQLLRAQLLISLSSKSVPAKKEVKKAVLRPSTALVTKPSGSPHSTSVKIPKVSSESALATLSVPVASKLGAGVSQPKMDVQALLAKYGAKAMSSPLPVKRTFSNQYKVSKAGKTLVRKDIYKSKKIQKVSARNFKRPLKSGVKRPQPRAQIAHPSPVANRFVIRLGEDTDSDEESEASSPQKLPHDPLPNKTAPIAPVSNDLLKSVDQFLKQVRQDVEKKQQPEIISSNTSPILTKTDKNVQDVLQIASSAEDVHKNEILVQKMKSHELASSPSSASKTNVISSVVKHRIEEDLRNELLLKLANKRSNQIVSPSVIKPDSNKTEQDISSPYQRDSSTKILDASTRTESKNIAANVLKSKETPKTKISNTESKLKISNTTTSKASAVRHLPSSQQLEYHRLKMEIARREELMKLKSRLGQPVSKASSQREVVLQEQPKLEITVRNDIGEIATSVRTVRQATPEIADQGLRITTVVDDTSGSYELGSEKEELVPAQEETTQGCALENTIQDTSNGQDEAVGIVSSEKFPDQENAKRIKPVETLPKALSPKRKNMPAKNKRQNTVASIPCHKRQKTTPGQAITNEVINLTDEEKKSRLGKSESQLLEKRQQMLEKLTLLASLLADLEQGQASTLDAEARVEALKRELARAENRAEEQRAAVKKLFAQVGQVRLEVAETRTKCAGLSKVCQVLGPKTLGSNYHLPQDGVEELKTHLQQVVELTKKTKQQLQISAPTSSPSVSSTNQATSHSTPVAPSLTPCQDGHIAHPKLIDPIATNSTLENSTFGPESCGGREKLVSASEILGFSSSSATDTSGPLESSSSVADTSVSETVDSSSTTDVTKTGTSDSNISIETCPVNTTVQDAIPSSTSAEQLMESMQAEMIPSESSLTDIPMQTVKSADQEEFKLRVKPLSLLVNSSNSSLQSLQVSSKQSLSGTMSSKPSLHPYVSPLEHMKPKFRMQQKQQTVGVVDPNGVLCPYALTGVCLDDECKFQHPRPSSTL